MKVLSLFCGCGGLDYGFHAAGYEVRAAFDLLPYAVDTYNLNFPGNVAAVADVAHLPQLSFHPDVIVGGPPCQEYSAAGNRQLGPRAELTRVYIRTILRVRPTFFVMENVRQLRTVGKEIYNEIIRDLRSAGYGLTEEVVAMSDYGDPQKRKRLIIVGHLGGADGAFLPFLHAERRPVASVRQYFERHGLPVPPFDFHHYSDPFNRKSVFSLDELHPTLRANCTMRTFPPNYRFYPTDATNDPRAVGVLTLEQRAAVQTFPPSFKFQGKVTKDTLIVGNSVPPEFSSALARALQRYVASRI